MPRTTSDVVRQDTRAPFDAALRRAREAAFPRGQFVGQESFMRADEIRRLADRAGVGPDVAVLDLCCGVAGPGRLLTAELGCRYLGVDCSPGALDIARNLAEGLPCRFQQAQLPPLPDGPFDVVLLLETMLAFPDKRSLVGEVARVLRPGGRFAFTVEEGAPLTSSERAGMPDADTVWLVEWDELAALLAEEGLTLAWREEHTRSHLAVARALHRAFRADSAGITRGIGTRATTELIAAHELWCDWLGVGRVRKFAAVAKKRPGGRR